MIDRMVLPLNGPTIETEWFNHCVIFRDFRIVGSAGSGTDQAIIPYSSIIPKSNPRLNHPMKQSRRRNKLQSDSNKRIHSNIYVRYTARNR
jgi:hypothetical protein